MKDNKQTTADRGQWTSSIGFIMAAAGAAIGLGNVWKFPFLTYQMGGGTFLLVYIIMLILFGIPVLITEMVLGRKGKSDPVGTYAKLSGDSLFWKIVGYIAILVNFIVLSFYSVVGGWITNYMFKYITGGVKGDIAEYFGSFVSNPYIPLLWYALFMGITVYVVAKGISDGIEKASNIMMPALFVLFIILAVRSLTIPGSAKGLQYYLKPDLSKLTGATFLMAMGQVLFTLNIGAGCTMTYASYLSEKENIPKLSLIVPFTDFLSAFLAGLVIIPAAFAVGIDPATGPPLLFITMPHIFDQMPMGVFFGLLFFILMLFAALSSAISMLEVNVAFLVDNFQIDRKKASITAGFLIFLLGIPSSLAQGVLADFTIAGLDFLSAMDFLASYILMPFGAFMMAIFIVRVFGIDNAIKEATNDGTVEFKHGGIWSFLIKYIVPVIIVLVFLSSVGIIKI